MYVRRLIGWILGSLGVTFLVIGLAIYWYVNIYSVQVINSSVQMLTDVKVDLGGRIFALGDLAPNQSRKIYGTCLNEEMLGISFVTDRHVVKRELDYLACSFGEPYIVTVYSPLNIKANSNGNHFFK